VDTALRIKSLLYDQGYTIPGARQALRAETAKSDPTSEPVVLSGVRSAESKSLSREERASPEDAGSANAADSRSTTNPALYALRDELRSLSAQLNQPVAGGAAPETQTTDKPARQRSTMPARTAEPAGIHLNQQDLFPSE
jgi:hypothetical protein